MIDNKPRIELSYVAPGIRVQHTHSVWSRGGNFNQATENGTVVSIRRKYKDRPRTAWVLFDGHTVENAVQIRELEIIGEAE